jgi:DNA helicase-2/ATP-dependent DNA helicase PcrA
VPSPLQGLTERQHEVVTHPASPLLVLGVAGSGKSTVLARRHAWLSSEGGIGAEHVLALTHSALAVDELRAGVEQALEGGFAELHVHSVHGFCAKLLRDEADEAGIDPFAVTLTAADRLALLLERVDELTLRLHDFRGNPAAMLAGVLARIDRLKEARVSAQQMADWAAALPAGDERAEREREFAQVYAAHDRMLREQGALDPGDLVLSALDLLERPHVRARVAARFRHVLVDDVQDLAFAHLRLVLALSREHRGLTAAGDPDQAILRARAAASKNLQDIAAELPDTSTLRLERSHRSPRRLLDAAQAVVAANPDRLDAPAQAKEGGELRLWRCSSERAQAQAAAAEVERLLREGAAPGDVAVLVRSVRQEGQAIGAALDERAVPYSLRGGAALFERAEVKDILAWLRLLIDPGDAGAVVRALARPPVELRAIDIARCVQIARRRRLDMVAALAAATESPQIDPAARERILGFLKLHRQIAAHLDTRPDLFVHRLIDRLGLRRQQLFTAQADVVDRLRSVARIGELAAQEARRNPQATGREFARHIAAVADAGLGEIDASPAGESAHAVSVMALDAAKGREFRHVLILGLQSSRLPGARRSAIEPIPDALLHEELPPDTREAHEREMRRLLYLGMTRASESLVLAYSARTERGALQPPSPFAEEARLAAGGEWLDRGEELFGPDEAVHAAFSELRDELLRDLPRIAGTLTDLRLDTDLDVNHGVVRYLELVKLAAVLRRPEGQSVAEALAQAGAVVAQGASVVQREMLESSPLDELVLSAERDARARSAAIARSAEPSLEAFLPRRGEGLLLSASDIDTYRTCPLKYKFARVFRIPSEPTLNQRFGILVHQVLERYHQSGGHSVDELLGLLEAGWRRGGFGASDEEQQLHAKAEAALRRYEERTREEDGEPVWFEKGFQFRMGAHTLRGRVDRVDRLPSGGYELIDYKTGKPRSAQQLREDVQLSLYAVAAREAWQVESERESYHYVLDDEKVALPAADIDRDWIGETVMEVADGILGQGFEPTPSYSACAMCDYRIACPAAER